MGGREIVREEKWVGGRVAWRENGWKGVWVKGELVGGKVGGRES